MTRRIRVAGAVVLTVALLAVALWAGLTATTTADYPPLQTADGRTVAGPHTLTIVRGDRVGVVTLCVIAAVATGAYGVTGVMRRR